jgi:hypothetical protein
LPHLAALERIDILTSPKAAQQEFHCKVPDVLGAHSDLVLFYTEFRGI